MKPAQEGFTIWRTRLIREAPPAEHAEILQAHIDRPMKIGALFCLLWPDLTYELFAAFFMNSQLQVVGVHLVSQGTVDASLVHPREIFRPAILANAPSVVLAHNHVTGYLTPSPEDKQVTRDMVTAGQLLGIKVVDHVIVGSDGSGQSILYG